MFWPAFCWRRVTRSPSKTQATSRCDSLFKALGMRVVGVPVDREGLIVDALPGKVRLVYVTPSHQYPLCVTMTLPRRQALLAWAERNNAAIIEDDYDSEFRFGGRPLEPLQTLDSRGAGHLCRLFLQDHASDSPAGFPGDTAVAAVGHFTRRSTSVTGTARRPRRRRSRPFSMKAVLHVTFAA